MLQTSIQITIICIQISQIPSARFRVLCSAFHPRELYEPLIMFVCFFLLLLSVTPCSTCSTDKEELPAKYSKYTHFYGIIFLLVVNISPKQTPSQRTYANEMNRKKNIPTCLLKTCTAAAAVVWPQQSERLLCNRASVFMCACACARVCVCVCVMFTLLGKRLLPICWPSSVSA